MRNRIKIVESSFVVDSDNKIVVCNLKFDIQFDKASCERYLFPEMWMSKFPELYWAKPITVRAKARCHSSDTFDEKIGMRIAESRAKTKMYKIALRAWKLCEEKLREACIECADMAQACEDAYLIEKNHVLKLIK